MTDFGNVLHCSNLKLLNLCIVFLFNKTKNFFHNCFCKTSFKSSFEAVVWLQQLTHSTFLHKINNRCACNFRESKFGFALLQILKYPWTRSHAVYMFLFMLLTVVCVHVKIQYMLTTGRRFWSLQNVTILKFLNWQCSF